MSTAPITPLALLNPLQLDQLRTVLVGILQAANDPITDWNDGAVRLTQMQYSALGINELLANTFPNQANCSYLGLVPAGQSGWIDLIAEQLFELAREPPVLTQQVVTVSSDGTSGPFTVGPGFFVISPLTGNRYFAITTGTLTTGAPNSVQVTVQAEGPNEPSSGQFYGDGPNTLTELGTPWAGVTVSNVPPNFSAVTSTPSPALGLGVVTVSGTPPVVGTAYDVQIVDDGQNTTAQLQYRTNGGPWSATTAMAATVNIGTVVVHFTNDVGGSNPSFRTGDVYSFSSPGSAIVQPGLAAETDVALIARCYGRWTDIAAIPEDKHAIWAKSANPAIVRVSVAVDTVIGGRYLVTIAGAPGTAPLSGTIVTEAQTVIDQQEGVTRISLVAAAANTTVTATNDTGGFVKAPTDQLAEIQAAANLAWTAYVDSTDIGGTIRIAKLEQILLDAGATDLALLLFNGAASNFILSANHAALAADLSSLTWIPVY
jgi:hypothetical protein